MILADKYYRENLQEIFFSGYFDEEPRARWKDGLPAHTKYISQIFEKYDISKGEFPITTLRNTAIKTGIKEILWIYQSQTSSIESARNHGIHWWEPWVQSNGIDIGQRYGATVKRYNLINNLLHNLKTNPFGRRHIMNLFQYVDLEETGGLYPCAFETIWSTRRVGGEIYVDMTLVQRSNDYCMAGHINKTQYVALMMMVASDLGYKVGVFGHYIHNLHYYDRHHDAVVELLERTPIEVQPKIELIAEGKGFYEIGVKDFIISGIDGIEKIKSPLEIAI